MEVPTQRILPHTGHGFTEMWPPAFDVRRESRDEHRERLSMMVLTEALNAIPT